VAPGPLEETIRAHQLVGHAVVVGDGRKYVSALITLVPEGLENWRSERGLQPLDRRTAITDADVLAAVQEAVDQANLSVSKAESIRRFSLLDTEFTVESGHLTPSLKLKRAAVVQDFDAEVARLYT
jgi:long-chain acyl-CoA synthetase